MLLHIGDMRNPRRDCWQLLAQLSAGQAEPHEVTCPPECFPSEVGVNKLPALVAVGPEMISDVRTARDAVSLGLHRHQLCPFTGTVWISMCAS
jgi:hypothetical protein